MRMILQPLTGKFDLCARLGLILVNSHDTLPGKIVHAALVGSPSTRAGIEPRDIVFAIDKIPWGSVRHATFSDRRSSELNLSVFVARYFTIANIMVRVPPEPYRPLEEIVSDALRAIVARPTADVIRYVNPRFEGDCGVLNRARAGMRWLP
jgi:hypothetical protein